MGTIQNSSFYMRVHKYSIACVGFERVEHKAGLNLDLNGSVVAVRPHSCQQSLKIIQLLKYLHVSTRFLDIDNDQVLWLEALNNKIIWSDRLRKQTIYKSKQYSFSISDMVRDFEINTDVAQKLKLVKILSGNLRLYS